MLRWLDDCQLIDLGPYGNRYTLFRNSQGTNKVAKRLDRAFGDVSWRNEFPESILITLRLLPTVVLRLQHDQIGHSDFKKSEQLMHNILRLLRMLGFEVIIMLFVVWMRF